MPGGKVKSEDKNLEGALIREIEEEIGCKIKIIRKLKEKVFGDYETPSREGNFLCRTYFAKIIEGTPELMEKEKADWTGYFNYSNLLRLEEGGNLAPNLRLALPKLKEYVK